MSWSVVNSIVGIGTDGGSFNLPPIDTTALGGATFLAAFICNYNLAAEPTIQDGLNTWTPRAAGFQNGSARGRFYFVNSNTPVKSSSHVLGVTGAASYSSLSFLAFKGSAASPQDQYATQIIGAGATSVVCNSITPTVAGALILSAIGFDTLITAPGVNSGLSIILSQNFVGGIALGQIIAWKEQATIAAIGPTWNWTSGTTGVAGVASFLPGSAPVGPVGKPWNLYQAMRRSR